MAKDILVENKLEWKNPIIFYRCQKSIFALTVIEKGDVDLNRNANMLLVLGTLKKFLESASENEFLELNQSKMGYDAGFIKDEFECNANKCECAHFNQTVIGKLNFL